MHVICDFDGTVTTQDTTDLILERLARPEWRDLEDAWLANRITAADCMRRQIALIDADRREIDSVLDEVELDPGFIRFVAWCARNGLPLSIVSDGVDAFIVRILALRGLEHLPVIANRLVARGGWRLEQPWTRLGCAAGSGVCKCDAARLLAPCPTSGTLVFVGDGRSDFCLSGRADILFAKGALAEYATGRAQPFHRFDTFEDVQATLTGLIGAPAIAATRH